MNDLAWWIAQNAATTALLVPVVWVVAQCRKSRPAEQHLLWLLLLVKLMSPPLVSWPWSVEALANDSSQGHLAPIVANADPVVTASDAAAFDDTAQGRLVAEPMSELPVVPAQSGAADVLARIESIAAADVVESRTDGAGQTHESPSLAADTMMIAEAEGVRVTPRGLWTIVAVWLAGCGVVAGRLVCQIRRQRRIVTSADRPPDHLRGTVEAIARQLRLTSVDVRVSTQIASPFVCCVGRPVLVWPQSLCAAEALLAHEPIIAHELAHIRRRDHWVAWLEAIAAPLWWWNPIYWLIRRRLDETRELACDAIALESSTSDRRVFAELLLAFSTSGRSGFSFAPLRAGIAPSHAFRRRLAMLFDKRASGRVSSAGLLLAGLLAAALLPSWAWSQEEPSQLVTPVSGDPLADEAAPTATAEADPRAATQGDQTPVRTFRTQADLAEAASTKASTVESRSARERRSGTRDQPRDESPNLKKVPLGDGKALWFSQDGGTLWVWYEENGHGAAAAHLSGIHISDVVALPPGSVTASGYSLPLMMDHVGFGRAVEKMENRPASAVLFFRAGWSEPSEQMEPIFDKLKKEGLPFRAIEVDRDRELARDKNVTVVPTFVAEKDGREVGRLVGAQSEQALRELAAQVQNPKTGQPKQSNAPEMNEGAPVVGALVRARDNWDQVRLLETELKLAELEIAEKEISLEHLKQNREFQEKLVEKGYAPQSSLQDMRLAEIELKKAQLKAQQVRIQLEAAKERERRSGVIMRPLDEAPPGPLH